MGEFYISAFTADFSDYAALECWAREYPGGPVGVELAADWAAPGFYERLEENLYRFRDLPVTLHGPFVEMCTQPGSEAERIANRQLENSCALYYRMNARSIVLHTHLRGTAPDRQEWARERVGQVLAHWIRRMTGEGMSVTVENVGYPQGGSTLFDQERFIGLFDRLPQEAGCLIDVGHAILNGWDIPDCIRRMGTRIRGYHIHTNDGSHDSHLPIYDQASVYSKEQMDSLLRTIWEVTPQAHLILEYSPRVRVTKERLHADMVEIANLRAKG